MDSATKQSENTYLENVELLVENRIGHYRLETTPRQPITNVN